MFIIRLDDASEYMNVEKWKRVENMLDKYSIIPIVGIIPDNKDSQLLVYSRDFDFWNKVKSWQAKGWHIALHGYDHVCTSQQGGINPVHQRSEFAGVDLEIQKEKIRKGVTIFKEHGIEAEIFFAPSHTYDKNTLLALKSESQIRIVSDSIAYDTYWDEEIYFIPQQAGNVRKLPFKTVTYCYHPNNMIEQDFVRLENFISKNKHKMFNAESRFLKLVKRKKSLYDKFLSFLYFSVRKYKQRSKVFFRLV